MSIALGFAGDVVVPPVAADPVLSRGADDEIVAGGAHDDIVAGGADQHAVIAFAVQRPADDAPVVNEIEYLDTGVILRVTPRVNTGGLVTMEIEQEVSFVADEITSGIDSPTIDQRRIQTTVAVQSGETVTLGGLIRDDRSSSNSGVPLLREIPVLGKLFSTTTEGAARTELIVLITPRVVRSQLDARQVTEELRRRMRAVAPLDEKLY